MSGGKGRKMNARERNKNKKSFWRKIRFKYKFSVINEGTLEEVWTFRLSRLSAFASLGLFAFLLVVITAIIIIMTPIRNYLPGYLDVEVRKEIMQNALRADSLERMLEIHALYLRNVSGILSGNMSVDSIREIDSLARDNPDYEIPKGTEEEAFVRKFEEEEKYNLAVLNNADRVVVEGGYFYKPLSQGVVSSAFREDRRHFGVDLVASPQAGVMAVMEGTVVYTGYDVAHGYVIQLQHKNGFISIYKHNETLLKRLGDQVIAGEVIATVGDTGEETTGPHLHFELWYKGVPVNPEDYIAF